MPNPLAMPKIEEVFTTEPWDFFSSASAAWVPRNTEVWVIAMTRS